MMSVDIICITSDSKGWFTQMAQNVDTKTQEVAETVLRFKRAPSLLNINPPKKKRKKSICF